LAFLLIHHQSFPKVGAGGNGAGPAPSATSIDSAVADILGD
jgi:hypothetical protein